MTDARTLQQPRGNVTDLIGGESATTRPDSRATWAGWVRLGVTAGLAAALALLPFEGALLRVVTLGGVRFVVTDLEAVVAVTVATWVLLLPLERRAALVPRPVTLALSALAVITLASATQAGPNDLLGFQVTARSALAWGLFLVAADLVATRSGGLPAFLVLVMLASGVASAAVGWIAASAGSAQGLVGAGRLFTIGGVARMSGSWDYPTIAAMGWSAAFLAALPVVLVVRRPALRIALALALALVGASVLASYTRGALLGLGAGLAVLVLVGRVARIRRLTRTAVITGVVLATATAVLYLTSPLPLGRLAAQGERTLYGARYDVAGRVAVAPGFLTTIALTVHNTGLATWRPERDQGYRLAAVWLSKGTRAIDGPHMIAATLPAEVPPGGSMALVATIRAPTALGEHLLAWDMQHAAVADFSERAVPVAVTRVLVDAEAAAIPQPAVKARRALLYPSLPRELSRAQLWLAAVRIVADRPLLGVGPGAYRRVHGAYLGLDRWDSQVHSNDLYLELAATTGLLGLAAFLATVLLAVRRQVRVLRGQRMAASGTRDGPGSRPSPGLLVMAGSLAATAAALAHGLVDYFLVFMPTAVGFWVILGIGLGVAIAIGRQPAAPDATRTEAPA